MVSHIIFELINVIKQGIQSYLSQICGVKRNIDISAQIFGLV